MAPFTPFFTEVLYQNLRKASNGLEESIHFCSFPQEEGKVLLIPAALVKSVFLGSLGGTCLKPFVFSGRATY